jgi:negative regulator of flagellin synthesis FlgM
MKIDNSIKTVSSTGATGAISENTTSSKSPRSTGKEALSEDSVSISPLSSQLQSISAYSGEVVDAGKVEEIKAAMSEGRFQVNTEVVGEKLLETVKGLLQSQQGKQ